MDLLLLRHARPARVEGTDGHADPPLTALGRVQAHAVTRAVGRSLDALYCSPARRARETAQPLAEHVGLTPIVDEGLLEFDWGEASYIPLEDALAERHPMLATWEQELEQPGPQMARFGRRVVEAIEGIVAAHAGESVAVVSHGGVMNAYLGHLVGARRFILCPLDYTGICRVSAASSGQRTIRTVNEACHLKDLAPASPTPEASPTTEPL